MQNKSKYGIVLGLTALGVSALSSQAALDTEVTAAITACGTVIGEVVGAIAVLCLAVVASAYGLMGVKMAAVWVKGLFKASAR